VSAAIQTSLSQLGRAVENLETSASIAQASVNTAIKSANTSQNDLFSKQDTAALNAPAANDLDTKAMANRLDNAIAKVEQILKEG